MPLDPADELRVAALEDSLADSIAKLGALEVLIETKFDFDSKKLYAEKYLELKPAEE